MAHADWLQTGDRAWLDAALQIAAEVAADRSQLANAPGDLIAGHGGQVLLSEVTATLVRDSLARDAGLIDLGEHHLRYLTRPERIFQVRAAGLRVD